MKKYICDCCGGQINIKTLQCEYCGTQYKDDTERIIKVETYTNPVREYGAKISIPAETLHNDTPLEVISEYATRNLIAEMSKCLAENMVIKYEKDYHTREHIFTGRVKIVHPINVDK
jgi:hypothetical protein